MGIRDTYRVSSPHKETAHKLVDEYLDKTTSTERKLAIASALEQNGILAAYAAEKMSLMGRNIGSLITDMKDSIIY